MSFFSLVLLAWCTPRTSVPSQVEQPTSPWVAEDSIAENEPNKPVIALEGTVNLAVDTQRSNLRWEWRRVLYSYQGDISFNQWIITFEDGVPIAGSFTIDMTTIAIDNGNQRVVDHLSSDDFFSVETYPEATLTIVTVEPTSMADEFLVTADLTIKGTTNPVQFVALFSPDRLQASGAFEIDRSLWDVRFGSPSFFNDLGDRAISNMIGFEVDVTFN